MHSKTRPAGNICNMFPEIETHDLHDIWFQQDGATCHTVGDIMTLLQ